MSIAMILELFMVAAQSRPSGPRVIPAGPALALSPFTEYSFTTPS